MRSPREQFKNAVLNYLEEEFEMMQKPMTPQQRMTKILQRKENTAVLGMIMFPRKIR